MGVLCVCMCGHPCMFFLLFCLCLPNFSNIKIFESRSTIMSHWCICMKSSKLYSCSLYCFIVLPVVIPLIQHFTYSLFPVLVGVSLQHNISILMLSECISTLGPWGSYFTSEKPFGAQMVQAEGELVFKSRSFCLPVTVFYLISSFPSQYMLSEYLPPTPCARKSLD